MEGWNGQGEGKKRRLRTKRWKRKMLSRSCRWGMKGNAEWNIAIRRDQAEINGLFIQEETEDMVDEVYLCRNG